MDKTSINAIRFLGVDMVNKANSGHPGIVLGAAPIMYTLFSKQLAFNPKEPNWFNRDRFVLSAGHGSALLYATLHLNGYDIPMKELKNFRQWGSKTPGHPEYGHTPGVDVTTGPLGQGIASAVGMAISEKYLGAVFNKDDKKIVDHYTYVLCGDGDLQEGISLEAISLAGHLALSKLIILFDSNDIQLDGPVNMASSENIKDKFESMNWNYIKVDEPEEPNNINLAIEKAKNNHTKPTLIEVKTIIGHASPHAGKSATHGAPLGEENTVITRQNLSWKHEPFDISQEIYNHFTEENKEKGIVAYENWNSLLQEYTKKYPELGKIIKQITNNGVIDIDFDNVFNSYKPKSSVATRVSSGEILTLLQKESPLLIGGSADLSSSTKIKGINGDFSIDNPGGRNINFGVREHAMAAIVNGLVLHGLKGFSGGFFIFSDYMKPAMRLAALMGIPSIFAFTHDSIAVGEDGPTHEPIEQLAGLRAVPNMDVIRPADTNEVMGAWELAITSTTGPTSILLTRQDLPTLENSKREEVKNGGYIISKEQKNIDAILIATGSEVSLAIEAQKVLLEDGIDTRVVSLPSFKRFEEQDEKYKNTIIPANIKKRVAIEMGSSFGWHKYIGLEGKTLTIDKFGASAPGGEVIEKYGFTVENLVKLVKEL
ncbi:transketolase [Alkalibaculum sp. M08DMB]|uniref:Transketolase n=1 Tax=Alkalibaculum sporogenes TaxID=2655001 RepID=A0A6A7K8F8_9FIRM|nr:transketolase [Alkalibaculum sporogenes]MPW25714.1 transketolase [Alkalibaculum sporogenes]